MKKLIAILLILATCISLCACGGGSKGYKTPEATVEAFLKCLKKQDLQGMLDCTYIDPHMENVTFAEYVGNIGYYYVGYPVTPNEYDFYADMQRQNMLSDYTMQIKAMVYTLLNDEFTIDDYYGPMFLEDDAEEWAEDFADSVDPEDLKTLEILEIEEAWGDLDSNERKENKKNVKQFHNADDIIFMAALIEVDGELYYKGFTLAEYDGKWYICALNNVAIGETTRSGATRIEDEDEFEELIG